MSQLVHWSRFLAVAGLATVMAGCITAKPMEEPAAPAAAPAPVDGDDDGDGVPNSKDECPDTRAGAMVDDRGCEIIARFENTLFRFDSAEIDPANAGALQKAADDIKAGGSGATYQVAGHTDSVGSDEYNMGLGQRRAESVANALISSGVAAGALLIKSYGETKPIADNATSEGRAMNRRVEIVRNGGS